MDFHCESCTAPLVIHCGSHSCGWLCCPNEDCAWQAVDVEHERHIEKIPA